jgi:hypothetical protein
MRRQQLRSIQTPLTRKKHRHCHASDVSPVGFEYQSSNWLQSAKKSRGDSLYQLECDQ